MGMNLQSRIGEWHLSKIHRLMFIKTITYFWIDLKPNIDKIVKIGADLIGPMWTQDHMPSLLRIPNFPSNV